MNSKLAKSVIVIKEQMVNSISQVIEFATLIINDSSMQGSAGVSHDKESSLTAIIPPWWL